MTPPTDRAIRLAVKRWAKAEQEYLAAHNKYSQDRTATRLSKQKRVAHFRDFWEKFKKQGDCKSSVLKMGMRLLPAQRKSA